MANLVSILVILSEVSIALISITAAIYGVGLPFLKGRLRGLATSSRAKKQELREALERRLQDEDFIKTMKSQVTIYEEKEKTVYSHLESLSRKRAVAYPCTFFSLSLFFSCFFMYFSTENSHALTDLVYFSVPTFFLVLGILYLMRALSAVEIIVLMPEAMPKINIVDFPKAVHMNEEKEITVKIKNIGDEIAHNVKAFMYFPTGFKILESSGATPFTSVKTRPGLYVVVFNRERLDVRVEGHLGKITVRTPSKPGKYGILVTFREEKLKYEEETLEIEVR